MLLLKPPAALTTPTPGESKETKICKHQWGCSLQPNEYLCPLKLKIHEWQIPVFLSKGNLLVVYEHLNNSTRYMILWYWSYDNILIWWSSYDDHLLVNGSALNSPGREAGKAALFTISGQGSGLGNGEEKKINCDTKDYSTHHPASLEVHTDDIPSKMKIAPKTYFAFCSVGP